MKFDEAVAARKTLVDQIGANDAYLVMAVALFIEEQDAEALAAASLTEGGNDKKIDLIYHDKDARRLVFAQGYMSSKNNDAAPANKASDLNTACAWLLSGDLSTVPTKLRTIVQECRGALQNGEIDSIDLLYIHNLPESINVARELQTVEAHMKAAVANDKIAVKSYEFGRNRIEHLFAAQDSHIAVMDDIEFPGSIGIRESGKTWSAAVSTVSGTWIHELYRKYGDELYSANYRGFLGADGRKRVNAGIRDTIENAPADFWAFNNGITILTLKLSQEKSKTVLRGISVINGAQTTGSIGSVDVTKRSVDAVRLLCRVIECSDQETIDNVVRFNNTQNAITTWDKFSNDEEQKRIDDEFAELGYNYNRKRGFSGTGDQIGIEEVIQPLLAYHGKPTDAVRGKNQLFINKLHYQNAFEGIKARHILLVFALSRAIDSKRLELKRKSDGQQLIAVEEKQLDLLRNLNFKPFLISVIAQSLETIVGSPCDLRTVGFKPEVARSNGVNELAARWLPVVEAFLPLLTTQVKPETFFRSLTADEDYLGTIKAHMDAMITATGLASAHRTFSELVAC